MTLLRIHGAWGALTAEEKTLLLMQPDLTEEEKALLLMQPDILPPLTNKVFVFGGVDTTPTVQDQTWRYYDGWTTLAVMTGVRYGHTAVLKDDLAYVMGGSNGTDGQTNNWEYDIAGNSWSSLTVLPANRYYHSAVIDLIDGRIFVMGGQYTTTLYGTNWMYDIYSDTWDSGLAVFPSSEVRARHAAVHDGDLSVYVMGGQNSTSDSAGQSTLWRYSVYADTWETLTSMPDSRLDHSAVYFNGSIYVFGGIKSSGLQNTAWKYDISGDSWSSLTNIPTSIGHNVAMLASTDDILVVGRSEPMYRYSISANSWSTYSAFPSYRTNMAACSKL